jgi:hypothetical protein
MTLMMYIRMPQQKANETQQRLYRAPHDGHGRLAIVWGLSHPTYCRPAKETCTCLPAGPITETQQVEGALLLLSRRALKGLAKHSLSHLYTWGMHGHCHEPSLVIRAIDKCGLSSTTNQRRAQNTSLLPPLQAINDDSSTTILLYHDMHQHPPSRRCAGMKVSHMEGCLCQPRKQSHLPWHHSHQLSWPCCPLHAGGH